jgi:hypothetical protein
MLNIRKESPVNNYDLSDIYELVMTPCESNALPETMDIIYVNIPTPKRKNIYVNFFEDDECLTPKLSTPKTPDANENTIHVKIPRGSELYLNYEKHDFT